MVKRFRWAMLAALGLGTAGGCSGRSERIENGAGDLGNGGTGALGGSVGKGGRAGGGSGGVSGAVALGGRAGSEGGKAGGGAGGVAGDGIAGDGGMAGQECVPLTAWPVDTARWCFRLERVTVGCLEVDEGCSQDGECFRRPEDGAAFVGSSTCLRGLGWRPCLDPEENASVPDCEEPGFGGNGGEGGKPR